MAKYRRPESPEQTPSSVSTSRCEEIVNVGNYLPQKYVDFTLAVFDDLDLASGDEVPQVHQAVDRRIH